MTIRKVYPDFKNGDKWVKNFTVDGKSVFTKAGSIWYNLRKRCSNFGEVKNKAYSDVSCSKNFEDFQYFAEWCNKQKGYSNEGWELDKDLLVRGNRIYSEDTCVFVPSFLNSLLVKPRQSNKELPTGCFSIEKSTLFKACIQNRNKLEYLGCYQSPKEASKAYLKRKAELCLEYRQDVLNSDIDNRVIMALSEISNEYLNKSKENT